LLGRVRLRFTSANDSTIVPRRAKVASVWIRGYAVIDGDGTGIGFLTRAGLNMGFSHKTGVSREPCTRFCGRHTMEKPEET